MTLKERVNQEQPGEVDKQYNGGVNGCPHQYPYLNIAEEDEWRFCQGGEFCNAKTCTVCWNQKFKEEEHG